MIYGYARVSTKQQNIERQIRNISEAYPEAVIIQEKYTGTKMNRPEWSKLFKIVTSGDVIIFDSVSRMSRNSDEGFKVYEELFNRGVELIFIKEHQIDTATYKKAMSGTVAMTGTTVDPIIKGINIFLMNLAKDQIKIAFDQAEKEVMDNRKRTSEGLVTAKLNGKQIGAVKGSKYTTKKSIEMKEKIQKYSKDFEGSLNDKDTMELLGLSRNTFYKYKKEIVEEV